MKKRICDNCGRKKRISEFRSNWRTSDGLSYFCKICDESMSSKEKRKATGRRYHWRNKEQRNKISREQHHKKYAKDKNYYRNLHLKELYGITIDEWNRMFQSQDGCCSICGRHASDLNKGLAVDHNHNTGEIRELLCQKCNMVLGGVGEDIQILKKIIKYLNKHQKQKS